MNTAWRFATMVTGAVFVGVGLATGGANRNAIVLVGLLLVALA